MIRKSVIDALSELKNLLQILNDETYCSPCQQLDNASAGQHFRHILEMFQCLLEQYPNSEIDYDLRRRDLKLETETEYAINVIDNIIKDIKEPNKSLTLKALVNETQKIEIETNYDRELLYNLEHCIHHQALIKVALNGIKGLELPQHFGYAPSTIKFIRSNQQKSTQ